MEVIAHDGIGTQIDGEFGTQQFDTIHDPLAAVFEIETRMGIFIAKKRTPDTSKSINHELIKVTV